MGIRLYHQANRYYIIWRAGRTCTWQPYRLPALRLRAAAACLGVWEQAGYGMLGREEDGQWEHDTGHLLHIAAQRSPPPGGLHPEPMGGMNHHEDLKQHSRLPASQLCSEGRGEEISSP